MTTNAVYQQGLGVVSADGLDTFVQTVVNVAALRSFTGISNMQVFLLGTNTPGDGGQGAFYFNSTSTSADNGTSVIVPNGAAQGAWIRVSALPTLTAYTVATLPAAGVAGRTAFVTDATSPTYLGALTGGGATVTPVFDTGLIWVSF